MCLAQTHGTGGVRTKPLTWSEADYHEANALLFWFPGPQAAYSSSLITTFVITITVIITIITLLFWNKKYYYNLNALWVKLVALVVHKEPKGRLCRKVTN